MTPYNEKLESAIIGSVLVDKRLDYDLKQVSTMDFYDGQNRQIWGMICEMDEENQPIEIFDLQARLLEQGHKFPLYELLETTRGVQVEAGKHVVKQLKDLSLMRMLQKTFQRLASKAEDYGDTSEIISEAEDFIKTVKFERESEQGRSKSLSDVMEFDVVPRLDKFVSGETVKLPFGFDKLDESTNGGAGMGELIILGAKPKQGKSALMTQIAYHVSNFVPCYYCSREMLNFENAFRVITQTSSKITLNHFRPGMYAEYKDYIAAHSRSVGNRPLFFDDKSKTVKQMKNEICLLRDRGVDIRAAFADYAQLMRGENVKGKSKADILEDIIYDLKDLSTDLEIAVYCNAQFNREGIDSAKPKMSDFAGSSAIEKAGNLILLWTLEQDDSVIHGGRKGQFWIEGGRNVAFDEFEILYKGKHAFFVFL